MKWLKFLKVAKKRALESGVETGATGDGEGQHKHSKRRSMQQERKERTSIEQWHEARKSRTSIDICSAFNVTTTERLSVCKAGITILINRTYIVIKHLGSGSSGQVKLAFNLRSKKLVAIKAVRKGAATCGIGGSGLLGRDARSYDGRGSQGCGQRGGWLTSSQSTNVLAGEGGGGGGAAASGGGGGGGGGEGRVCRGWRSITPSSILRRSTSSASAGSTGRDSSSSPSPLKSPLRRFPGRSSMPMPTTTTSSSITPPPLPSLTDSAPAEDFVREIAILKRLSHPNIVQLVEVIDDPASDCLLLVMGYVEGSTLQPQQLQPGRWRPVPEQVAWRYTRDVLCGLEYLHCHGVVHGDLKPANFIQDSLTGVVRILDFGSAVLHGRVGGEEGYLRGAHVPMSCTPGFRSPESLAAGYRSGFGLDMWALGVCLYLWVYGELPFKGSAPFVVYENIRSAPLVLPVNARLSPQLTDMITRLLDKDPLRRLTVHDAVQHPWVTAQGLAPLRTSSPLVLTTRMQLTTATATGPHQPSSARGVLTTSPHHQLNHLLLQQHHHLYNNTTASPQDLLPTPPSLPARLLRGSPASYKSPSTSPSTSPFASPVKHHLTGAQAQLTTANAPGLQTTGLLAELEGAAPNSRSHSQSQMQGQGTDPALRWISTSGVPQAGALALESKGSNTNTLLAAVAEAVMADAEAALSLRAGGPVSSQSRPYVAQPQQLPTAPAAAVAAVAAELEVSGDGGEGGAPWRMSAAPPRGTLPVSGSGMVYQGPFLGLGGMPRIRESSTGSLGGLLNAAAAAGRGSNEGGGDGVGGVGGGLGVGRANSCELWELRRSVTEEELQAAISSVCDSTGSAAVLMESIFMEVTFPAKHQIIRAGDPLDRIYLITAGEVEIYHDLVQDGPDAPCPHKPIIEGLSDPESELDDPGDFLNIRLPGSHLPQLERLSTGLLTTTGGSTHGTTHALGALAAAAAAANANAAFPTVSSTGFTTNGAATTITTAQQPSMYGMATPNVNSARNTLTGFGGNGGLIGRELSDSSTGLFSRTATQAGHLIVAAKGPGDSLGFAGMLPGGPGGPDDATRQQPVWSANVRARTQVTAFTASVESLHKLARTHPQVEPLLQQMAVQQETDIAVAEAMRALRLVGGGRNAPAVRGGATSHDVAAAASGGADTAATITTSGAAPAGSSAATGTTVPTLASTGGNNGVSSEGESEWCATAAAPELVLGAHVAVLGAREACRASLPPTSCISSWHNDGSFAERVNMGHGAMIDEGAEADTDTAMDVMIT